MRRFRRAPGITLALLVAAFAGAQFFPATSSSFSGDTSNSGNTVSAAADWVGPTVTATVLQKSTGGTVDAVRQGATFYVYANATDSGNPASGVASVTASVGTIATVSSAAMTSGSWTVGGTTYGWRSALLTAKSPLASGSYSWSAGATDSGGNAGSATSDSVSVDNTSFDGDNLTYTDNGTVNKLDTGDVLRFVYTKGVDPNSIVAGWDGTATTVKAAVYDAAVYGTASDLVAVGNTALTVQIPVGTWYLGGDYINASQTTIFNATMAASGSDVVVTLGTVASNSSALKTASLPALGSWTVMAGATDGAGNAATNSTYTQFGATGFTAANKTGGTAGRAEQGDTISFVYNRTPSASSILSGWSGSSTSVTVKLIDKSVTGAASDTLAVYSTGGTLLGLGNVVTGGDFVNSGYTVSFASSTMVRSGGTITITLGSPSPAQTRTDSGGRKPVWTPDDTATDALGAGSSVIPYTPASTGVEF